jgi:kynurenine formamidase
MKRRVLATVFLVVLALKGCAQKTELPSGRLIDLTHSFDQQTIYWPTEKGFEFETGQAGITEKGYYYTANRFCSAEHGGTHIDAPIHFFNGRNSLDAIPLRQLIGRGALVDVSLKCAKDSNYQVAVDDLVQWEAKHKEQLNDAIVLLRTGFGTFWPSAGKYLGTEERGLQAVAKLHFPGLHPEAAKWLAQNRSVRAVGIDTASIDFGQSTHFQSHVSLFEKNIPALENVANLGELPEKGFVVLALPMKIRGGSGGPVRIVAMLNQ